ncbi:PiggyBac transposable element-derived protein 4, partial [Operophtera brumata]
QIYRTKGKKKRSAGFLVIPVICLTLPLREPVVYCRHMTYTSKVLWTILFLNAQFMNLILDCTNKYGNRLKAAATTSRARFRQWTDVSVAEFKTFLGILMGTIKLNRMVDYWSSHYLFRLSPHIFMSKDSVGLTEELLCKNSYVTGTLRANRIGNPAEVTNTKLKPGESCIMHNRKKIVVSKWHDKREIMFISSEHTSHYQVAVYGQSNINQPYK